MLRLWKRNVLELLDERLVKAEEFNNKVMRDNLTLQETLVKERNALHTDRQILEQEKADFNLEKESIFKAAHRERVHLEAELEFIKKHRMLPADCKFYTTVPRTPRPLKKLKKVN